MISKAISRFCCLFLLLIVYTTRIDAQKINVPDTSGFIEADGARLFFRAIGNGKPLLVLHGGPGMSHDYLAPQFINLLAGDYKLIFYDQRASGRSTGLNDTLRITMTQFVKDIEHVRKALSLNKLNLIGHSFGGLLAMFYAATHPNQIDKLLLLDSSPASWELNFPHFRRTIAERLTEADRRELAEIDQASKMKSYPQLTERSYKIYFRTFFQNKHLAYDINLGIDSAWIANSKVTNAKIWRDLGRYDIHHTLDRINAPTLIVYCTASTISLDGSKVIHEKIPNSKLLLLTDVGHFPYIEAPQVFSATVKTFFW